MLIPSEILFIRTRFIVCVLFNVCMLSHTLFIIPQC